MKQIELNLQKRLLIVEAPEGELTAIGNGDEVYYAIKKDETFIKILDGKKWKLICKGSELTEEIARGLVKSFEFGTREYPDLFYLNYKNDCYQIGQSVISFISAIEAQGYYWGSFPSEKISWTEINKWKEYESKTFNPEKTLIFEILL